MLISVEKAESNRPAIINTILYLRYFPIPCFETYFPIGNINDTEVIKKTKLIAFNISIFKFKSNAIVGNATVTILAMN